MRARRARRPARRARLRHRGLLPRGAATSSRDNGARIDAIRAAIAEAHAGTWLEPLLLTPCSRRPTGSTPPPGVQMAYLKQWAPRATATARAARARALLPGPGRALRGDAADAGRRARRRSTSPTSTRPTTSTLPRELPRVGDDRRGDAPEHYGVACKRERLPRRRPPQRVQPARRPGALRARCSRGARRLLVLSYNDESWLPLDELRECARPGARSRCCRSTPSATSARRSASTPPTAGVGKPRRLRNTEYLLLAGSPGLVRRAEAGAAAAAAPALAA